MGDDGVRTTNREYRGERRRTRRRRAWDLFAGLAAGFPFARRESTRVQHPHEPGTDPRDQRRRFDSPR